MPGTADLVSAWEEFTEHLPAYKKADKFYAGPIGEVFASERIRWLLKRAGVNRVDDLNYSHIPVDTVANRLDITSVTVAPADGADDETDDKDDGKPSPAQAALDKLWADNELDAESDGLHLDVSKHGDSYLFVWPATDGDAGAGKVVGVDIRVNDAESTRAIYQDEDPLKMAYVLRTWTITDKDPRDGKPRKRTRANMVYDDRIERYISAPGGGDKGLCEESGWEPYADDGKPAVIEHDLGRIPYFHFRNGRPYGRPEHFHAYGPQELINKLVVADASQVDFQSFPQRYALMDPAADQVMGNSSNPFHPDDDIDDPESEDNESQLSAEPGVVWKLWAKSVGQFEAAPADAFLSRFDRYVQAMAEVTETPLYRFGSKFAQTPSGEALRVADSPTVNRVENRRSRYGPVWADALEFALSLLGHKNAEVLVTWKPIQQVTDGAGWSVTQQKIDAGVPREVALVETGNYTDDQVEGWLSEDADSALIRRIEAVAKIAAASQQLGAAVGLGVLDRELVSKLLQYALGEMAGDPDLAEALMTADAPPEPEKAPDPAEMMKAMAAQQPGGPPPADGEQPPADSQPTKPGQPVPPPPPPKPVPPGRKPVPAGR